MKLYADMPRIRRVRAAHVANFEHALCQRHRASCDDIHTWSQYRWRSHLEMQIDVGSYFFGRESIVLHGNSKLLFHTSYTYIKFACPRHLRTRFCTAHSTDGKLIELRAELRRYVWPISSMRTSPTTKSSAVCALPGKRQSRSAVLVVSSTACLRRHNVNIIKEIIHGENNKSKCCVPSKWRTRCRAARKINGHVGVQTLHNLHSE